jgi:hypothetical protein
LFSPFRGIITGVGPKQRISFGTRYLYWTDFGYVGLLNAVELRIKKWTSKPISEHVD